MCAISGVVTWMASRQHVDMDEHLLRYGLQLHIVRLDALVQATDDPIHAACRHRRRRGYL